MAMHEDEKQAEQQLTEFKEAMSRKEIEADKQRAHERQLKEMDIRGTVQVKKLETEAATARLRATTRSDVWARFLVGICKAPALPLALIIVFILELKNKDAPDVLDEFIHL